ncbi:S9 family peptidase [Chitinophaga rhizophila]|uniref:Prolyl oligopeptidase family serine peptidase n=1 Tax=Chitinophaga rhizophila TaxID=2866212 RepID=A0ABS7G5S7_9BACT|nr:prolyl oligopeptidase family serine peptidase [Chitinophaga rhizophila]MBW8682974.1 prolyl oligopeptidase family serine peptidase [Chitinophaga rhizophila]
MQKGILLAAIAGCIAIHPAVAQRTALDTANYKEWKRAGSPSISYDGAWAAYSIADNQESYKYLVNTHSGKTIQLKDADNPEFFDAGKWMKYSQSSDGKQIIALTRLKDGRKIEWTKSSYILTLPTSPWISYSNWQDGTSSAYLYNIDTQDSVTLPGTSKFNLFNGEKSIICLQNNKLITGPLKGAYKPVFDENISDYTFNKDTQEGTFLAGSRLYFFSVKTGKTRLLLDYSEIKPPAGYTIRPKTYDISDKARHILLEVSYNNSNQRPKMVKPADTGFELELWTWNEPVSQRRQRRGVYNRTQMDDAQFIYHLSDKKVVEVMAEKSGRLLTPETSDYNYAIIADQQPYIRLVDWKYDTNADLYMVDVRTGERKLLLKDSPENPQWSPNGQYAVLFNRAAKEWQVLDPVAGVFKGISAQIGHPVFDEDHDHPSAAGSYGIAGWTDDGNTVLVYDRYDIWAIDLLKKQAARCITNGYGRSHQVQLRWMSTPFINRVDLSRPMNLQSFNERTMSHGVYRLVPGKGVTALADNPDYSVQVAAISGDGKSFTYTKSNFHTYPDLWVTSSDFKKEQRLTDINPQQHQYSWGTAKLVEWKNYEGNNNKGVLYVPEGYDAGKTYPMIVDFYETHTDGLHAYLTPEYSTSTIDIPTYVSNGYVVFRPDVHFKTGVPGESTYSAVVSGTEEMIKRGIADKDRIGLQGHSWSGFQVYYLVTRTNIFKCVNAGAGVSNATYNYFAIRQNGAPCMFKYEVEQSRIGKNLWEGREEYLQSSPIFNADKIQTPMLIFHNDKDGAVAFTQGLDMFLAMRRLSKPAWLLNYKGENHSLNGEEAQKDWTLRMGQFFDHYLKGKPMPRWMKEGISIDERNVDQKYDY